MGLPVVTDNLGINIGTPGYAAPTVRGSARGPKPPPSRSKRHRWLVYTWFATRAAETIGPSATPCDYAVVRLEAGATHRELADECREWCNSNHPGVAWSPAFPGHGFIDVYGLGSMHGVDTPESVRVNAARVVSKTISNVRCGPRLSAGRAAARAARKTATRIDTDATTTSAITPEEQRGMTAATS